MNFKKNINCIPMFFFLAFSGNPLFFAEQYSKLFIVIYTSIFFVYIYNKNKFNIFRNVVKYYIYLILFIFVIVLFQNIRLGFVSYPGVFALIIKVLLAIATIEYYRKEKIDFKDIYINIIAKISKISIPLFIINQVLYLGIKLKNDYARSIIIFTFTKRNKYDMIIRNSGMFWEPGAYAGYILLALIFVFLLNGKISVGKYRNSVIALIIALITTMSTTGYLVITIMFSIYLVMNFSIKKLLLLPIVIIIFYNIYISVPFLKTKVVNQYSLAINLNKDEVSNTRFGSLLMDLRYIETEPIFGNGLSYITRYRFHPWITEDIGNGNGMSNFMACWGIPLFFYWILKVYKYFLKYINDRKIVLLLVGIMLLIMQGEQFLNFPIFLSFFIL